MKTVPFKSVYEGVLRQHGLSPESDTFRLDTAKTIVDRINNRVRQAYQFWRWPELEHTEERALRYLWNNIAQFLRVNEDGEPDELFFNLNGKYYRVRSLALTDPPVGTLPTNTAYFEEITNLDTYIPYDVECQYPIGTVYGVFSADPRANQCTCCNHVELPYHPSEKGIDICGTTGPTIWIDYQSAAPEFTILPWFPDVTYSKKSRVYDPETGECYISIVPTNIGQPVTRTDIWSVIKFPQKFSEYVKFGTYADGLRESDTTNADAAHLQIRMGWASSAEAKAKESLEREVDLLLAQGQRFYYGIRKFERNLFQARATAAVTTTVPVT